MKIIIAVFLLLTVSVFCEDTLKVTSAGLTLNGKSFDIKNIDKSKTYVIEWEKSATYSHLTAQLPLNMLSVNRKKGKLYSTWVDIQKESEPPPSLDIFVREKDYVYQGGARSQEQMGRIVMGLGAAMGSDVVINLIGYKDMPVVRMEEALKLLKDFNLFCLKKASLAKPVKDKKNGVLSTVAVENVEIDDDKKKTKEPKKK